MNGFSGPKSSRDFREKAPRVEANNFPDLFCGKCGSYFLGLSVVINSRKLELPVVLEVESGDYNKHWSKLFSRYHFQFRNIQRAKGNGETFIQRQKEVRLRGGNIVRFRSVHHNRKTAMQGEQLTVKLMIFATARDLLEAAKKKDRIYTGGRLRLLDALNVWS